MKLKRLKINSDYRSLEAGFEINFEPDLQSPKLNPICLVGPNGSGKSNVLEAISDIFYYLDLQFLGYSYEPKINIPIEAFEIEYFLPLTWSAKFLSWDYDWKWDEEYFLVKIVKENRKNPQFSIVLNDHEDILSGADRSTILPTKIWGYSSGANEILSIPFKKIDLLFFKENQRLLKKEESIIIEESRMHYIEYQTCSLLMLSNFIMFQKLSDDREDVQFKLNVFREKFGIKSLDSFKFTVRYTFWMKKNLKPLSRIVNFLANLKNELPANCVEQVNKEYITFNINLKDEVQIKAFKNVASGANGLYKFFESLNFLNNHTISEKRRNEVLFGTQPFYSLENIGDSPDDVKPFIIEEVMMDMEHLNYPIPYKTLSDGEHQAISILSLINMIDEDGVLCLLDEPDTHLNPKWKYDFINILNEIHSQTKNQVLITTHDPIFISGLRKEDVILFKRKRELQEGEIRWTFPEKDLKGMGVDHLLTSPIFGLNSSIDYPTYRKILDREFLLSKSLKGIQLVDSENNKLKGLTSELSEIDVLKPINNPIYNDFILELSKGDISAYYDVISDSETRSSRVETSKLIINKLREQGKI